MRWIHGSYYSELGNASNNTVAIGIVYREKLGWWGYSRGVYTDDYATRAAAMRAVASLADPKKYPT